MFAQPGAIIFCMSSPHAPGPIKPAKPKNFTQGNVGVMLHDSPHTSTVVGMLINEDETFTASITSGANLFAVANIQANNLELEDVSGELPGPHHGTAFVWQIVPAGTGNGTTPFALRKDQLLYLNVTA